MAWKTMDIGNGRIMLYQIPPTPEMLVIDPGKTGWPRSWQPMAECWIEACQ